MNCEEQIPQATCASNDLFGVTPESRGTNHGNNAIFSSKESLAFTPDNMGNRLKKGTYSMVI